MKTCTLTPSTCYDINERVEKRTYDQRVLEVDHGSFTPLVFSATGGMSRETTKFYKLSASMISEKRSLLHGLQENFLLL